LKKSSFITIALIFLVALAAILFYSLRQQEDGDTIPEDPVVEIPEDPRTPVEPDKPEEPAVEIPEEHPGETPEEKPPEEPVKEDGPKTLFQMPADSITTFRLVEKGRTVSLLKIQGQWIAEGGSLNRFDPEKILPIIGELSQIDSIRTASFSGDGSGTMGIDRSRSITIGNGKEETTFYPGTYSESEKGYYLSMEGTEEIYLVKQSLGPVLTLDPDDLRDREIALPDLNSIQTLTASGSSSLSLIPYKRFDQFAPEGFLHMMESPYAMLVPVDRSRFSQYLDQIASPLLIADFIDSGSPGDYGIDESTPDFELTDSKGRSLALHLGRSAGKGKIYGKLGTEKQIFTLKEEDLRFINPSPFSLADKQIRPMDREKIDTLNITTPELVVMLTIDKMGGGKSYALNGLEISEEDFLEIYDAVTSLRLEGEIDAPASTGESDVTLSWKLKDGGSRWAYTRFHPHGTNDYAVTQYDDYAPLFTISRSQVDAMLEKVTAAADRAYGF